MKTEDGKMADFVEFQKQAWCVKMLAPTGLDFSGFINDIMAFLPNLKTYHRNTHEQE